jgi:tRNA (cytidine/uridine-2'-O-)-methyltransferase
VAQVVDVATQSKDGQTGHGQKDSPPGASPGAPLVHLVLDRPAIAGNVGACVRLAAATGAALHVCGATSFAATDRGLWRAGLDYWPKARVHFHQSLERCLALLERPPWIVEVGGDKTPWDAAFLPGDVVVLGPEKGSVQASVVKAHKARVLTLPQRPGIRSLNLAQCAAVVVFEAVRQGRIACAVSDPAA